MTHWGYLPFLLIWALPVVAVEWIAGARHLWRERRVWPWIVLALTAWFSLADAVAIAAGIWRFDTRSLLGVYLGPVPVEEILFYLLTSLMVVQGFVLIQAALAGRLTLRRRPFGSRSRPRSTDSAAPQAETEGGRAHPAPMGSVDG